jgi:autoinducer 2-degrading protein
MNTKNIIVKCVTIEVFPEHNRAFLEATIENGRLTRKEIGNLRFDILQSLDNQNRFFLYETYASQSAIDAHKTTDYYQRWCEIAEPLMIRPRETLSYQIIEPLEFKKS